MRLPEAGAAVDEERVVCLRRRLGDRERGRMREAVRRPDDERVEGVFGVESPALGAMRHEPLDRRDPRGRMWWLGLRRRRVGHLQLDRTVAAGDVAYGRPDQLEEV